MDEWDKVVQQIREMQETGSGTETASAADYWKQRYERERQLWEEQTAAKELEQSENREQALHKNEGMKELKSRINELEQRISMEKLIWEERSRTQAMEGEMEKMKISTDARVKVLEAELDKRRADFESRLRIADQENDQLRFKVHFFEEQAEEEKHKRKMIENEKNHLEEAVKTVKFQQVSLSPDDVKKVQQLEMEKSALSARITELEGLLKDRPAEEAEPKAGGKLSRVIEHFLGREKNQMDSFDDMARGFAHKIRNQLGVISGTIQLCISNFKLEDDLKVQMVAVDETSQEMLKAIEDYLALAKVPQMALQETNLKEFLNSAVPHLEDGAKNQNIIFEKRLADNLPSLSIDANLLRTAFKNIFDNALEATASGKTITVTASMEQDPTRAVIRVIDTGKGIPENHLKKVFQPYFTSKKNKKGLGLSIAKHIVELHRGDISITSAKDQGTTLTVQLFPDMAKSEPGKTTA